MRSCVPVRRLAAGLALAGLGLAGCGSSSSTTSSASGGKAPSAPQRGQAVAALSEGPGAKQGLTAWPSAQHDLAHSGTSTATGPQDGKLYAIGK